MVYIQKYISGLILLLVYLLPYDTGCQWNKESAFSTALDEHAIDSFNRAKKAYRQGAYKVALTLADSAIGYAPNTPEMYKLRGEILFRVYRYDEVHKAYQKVVELDPDFRGGWYTLGHSAFYSAQYHKAISYYGQELENLERMSKRTGQALDERVPATIMLQIGRSYAKLGVADSALSAYLDAIEIDSLNATGHAWVAELYQEQGKLVDALPYARRALDLDPDNVDNKYLFGALLFQTGRFELAAEYLADVVHRRPWHDGAHYNLGRALMMLGREEEGQRYLDKTEELQAQHFEIERIRMNVFQYPTNPEKWISLADLLWEVGRKDEARDAYRIARDLGN